LALCSTWDAQRASFVAAGHWADIGRPDTLALAVLRCAVDVAGFAQAVLLCAAIDKAAGTFWQGCEF